VIRSRGYISITVRPAFAAWHEQEPAGPDLGHRRHPDGALHVGDRHAAVGAVHDHREAVADAELGGDVAQLDGGAQGRARPA
jgi:hypothetical protein